MIDNTGRQTDSAGEIATDRWMLRCAGDGVSTSVRIIMPKFHSLLEMFGQGIASIYCCQRSCMVLVLVP
ncbi:hypothetical protein IF2G_08920 [Cordyceps javanica]|nr:hypothetical protein IF2G_08920 [Cordyceps javanica]